MHKEDKYRFLIISFSLYMFMYMTLLTAVNHEASGIVNARAQLVLYYVDMFCVTLGFILYAVFYDIFKRRTFPLYAAIINTVVLLSSLLIKIEAVFMVLAPIAGLFLGFFGGFFYTYMALSFQDERNSGMTMGLAMSLAVFAQWFLQIFIGIPILYIFIIDVCVMIFFICYKDRYKIERSECEIKAVKMTDVLPIFIVTGIIFLVFCFDNRMENILTAQQFKTINIYTWPRLFLIVSYLGYGYVHDKFEGLYDQLSVLVAALLSIISLILLSTGSYLNLAMSIFYLELGLIISYYNLVFWKICLNKKHLSFWASMGRIIDGGISTVLALVWKKELSLFTEIIIDIIVIILIVILIFTENRKRIDKQGKPDLEEFIRKHELTKREQDVFNKLLKPETGVEQMADELFISRRTLQRHISSIYEKCGVSNRAGLIALVYKE
ncbi:MAG: helix-turn-helix transcriptional regulator [Erysipelotrichaceae bacterium]|nr:helix-turn-helix transcriptional regulator [Erysipelotrichaceae bacterium]